MKFEEVKLGQRVRQIKGLSDGTGDQGIVVEIEDAKTIWIRWETGEFSGAELYLNCSQIELAEDVAKPSTLRFINDQEDGKLRIISNSGRTTTSTVNPVNIHYDFAHDAKHVEITINSQLFLKQDLQDMIDFLEYCKTRVTQ